MARSMVLASDTADGTRYRLLETLGGSARSASSGPATRHAALGTHAVLVGFMERAWQGLWSDDDGPWIRRVGRAFENVRVAVYEAFDRQDGPALEVLLKPHMFWAWHALHCEVGDWAEAAVAVEPEPRYARGVALRLLTHSGRFEAVRRLARALRSFIQSGDRRQLWTSAHHLAYFLARVGYPDEAWLVWKEPGGRQAYAAQHHRDELAAMLGAPGEPELTDDELVERVRGVLKLLEDPDAG